MIVVPLSLVIERNRTKHLHESLIKFDFQTRSNQSNLIKHSKPTLTIDKLTKIVRNKCSGLSFSVVLRDSRCFPWSTWQKQTRRRSEQDSAIDCDITFKGCCTVNKLYYLFGDWESWLKDKVVIKQYSLVFPRHSYVHFHSKK